MTTHPSYSQLLTTYVNTRDSLITRITKESKKKNPKPKWDSVWLNINSGKYYYGDLTMHKNIITPLVEEKILVFKGVEEYKGLRMFRYVLSNYNSYANKE